MSKLVFRLLLLLGFSPVSFADTFILPPADLALVGDFQSTNAKYEDTLLDIAREFDLGQIEIVIANPDVDRWMPGKNTKVFLPKRYILPNTPRRGLVLNLAELRLFYYPSTKSGQAGEVTTHPISIGRMDWETPLGKTKVVAKVKDPSWTPPASIKAEHAADGDPLPNVVPPGPDNPLGRYAVRLGIPGYLIHSTNKPFGVGMRVSHGCIRMLPKDIEALFPRIKVGTAVHIVNQPVKLGWFADTFYVEAHPPFEEDKIRQDEALGNALSLIEKDHPLALMNLDSQALTTALRDRRGIPVAVSRKSDPADDHYIPPGVTTASTDSVTAVPRKTNQTEAPNNAPTASDKSTHPASNESEADFCFYCLD